MSEVPLYMQALSASTYEGTVGHHVYVDPSWVILEYLAHKKQPSSL